jgi:succinyl-CoA synthetase beta subunit
MRPITHCLFPWGFDAMIVDEDYAKRLMARYGLHVPSGGMALTPDEAVAQAERWGGNAVIKALIPTGGRGKAGGVKVCPSVDEVRDTAASILNHDLLGYRVERVLVEQAMTVEKELYVGFLTNFATSMIDLVVSYSGGVDIESTAQTDSEAVLHLAIEPGDVLPAHRLYGWLRQVNCPVAEPEELAFMLATLYRAAADLDAILLEINPLAVVQGGGLTLLDCKLEIDDNALVRQPHLLELYLGTLSSRELRARELGVSYVPLEGDIGVMTSGAGLGMATLDLLLRAGLSPANFLDTGGGISRPLVQGALELIMEPPRVKGAIINLYGGINRMLEAAQGIVAALQNIDGNRPVAVKILGNQEEEAWEMLEPVPNVHVIRVVQTEVAVDRLAALVK